MSKGRHRRLGEDAIYAMKYMGSHGERVFFVPKRALSARNRHDTLRYFGVNCQMTIPIRSHTVRDRD